MVHIFKAPHPWAIISICRHGNAWWSEITAGTSLLKQSSLTSSTLLLFSCLKITHVYLSCFRCEHYVRWQHLSRIKVASRCKLMFWVSSHKSLVDWVIEYWQHWRKAGSQTHARDHEITEPTTVPRSNSGIARSSIRLEVVAPSWSHFKNWK